MAWFTFPFNMLSNGVWFTFPFNMLSNGVVYLPIQYAF